MNCPCCGQPVPESFNSLDAVDKVKMPIIPRAILNLLLANPDGITAEELKAGIYSPSNEPEWAVEALRVQLTHLRNYIRHLGWTVTKPPSPGRHGYKKDIVMPKYKLEKIRENIPSNRRKVYGWGKGSRVPRTR